jgi:ABC-type glycerol-3-phosphate transport system substrate-binding protein
MKKCISMFLVIVLVLAVLTACDTTGSGGVTTKKPDDSGTAAQVHKLKVLGPVDESLDIKFSDREEYPIWKRFEEMLKSKNLEITYETVPSDQYSVVIQTRLASSSDLPDLVNVSTVGNTSVLALAKQGMFLPINKIIEKGDGGAKRFLNDVIPFVTKLNTSPDGNMYWITNAEKITYQGKSCSTCMIILIRKDWLENLGLSAPKTAEEYKNVMKEFRKRDANKNGVEDEILALNPANFNNGIAQWFGLGTGITSVAIEEQKIVSPWYQPGIKEYFRYLNELVNEGILDTSLFGSNAGDRINQKLIENKIGSQFSYAMQAWLEPAIKADNPQYLPIGPLKAVDGITPANSVETPNLSWGTWAVTKNCKDEEGMAALIDILYSEEYQVITCWGVEGETFEVVDGVNRYLPGIGNKYRKEMAANRICSGQYLWGDSVFPRLRFAPMETEINNSPAHKADYQRQVAFYKPTFPNDNNAFLAMPSDDQIEEVNSIITDLTTYSQELATNLALGEKPLDDWDKYMADMKELGLDRLIEINQIQLDSYNSR